MSVTYNPPVLTDVSTGATANAATWNSGYAQLKSDLNSGSYDPYFRHMVISLTTGEDITAGNAVRISGATILKCDSGSAAGITGFLGFALETKTNGNSCKVAINGIFGLTSLTAGAVYYLSTSGGITTSKPVVYAKPIGVAISATSLLILPNTESNATFYSLNITGKMSVYNGGAEVFNIKVGTTTQMEMELLGGTGFIYATVLNNDYGKFMVRDNYSNSHPAYSFLSDPQTGIGNASGSVGTLNFITSGTEAMRIDNDQNVGIGTTTPEERLDVAGAICISDGMTAPSTHSGKASIYVDAADGDLKVKFGDGTVKTIVSDT